MRSGDWEDFYELLGVAADATPDEIRAAYRREAKRWHPDARHGDAARMKALADAYAVLSDPKSRAAYDEMLVAADGPPVPRLIPDSVTWRFRKPTDLEAVTVRLRNEGGAVTTIEPERTGGAFWQIADAIAIMEGEDLVDFVIDPAGTDVLPPGMHTDSVAFLLDGVPAVLALKLEIPAARAAPPSHGPIPRAPVHGADMGAARAYGPPGHAPTSKPIPTAVAASGSYLGGIGGSLIALLGALALLGAPFGIMAIWAPIFNRNQHKILIDLLGLAIGLGCIALLIAGIAAVGAALMNVGRSLFARS